jgi:hypothetical protein
MRNYRGDFESHLTIRADKEAALEQFQAWCGARGFKCVRIVLARGRHVEQPMATWRRRNTTLPFMVQEAEQYAAEAARDDFTRVRLKIEAAPTNEEVPADDAEAAAHDARNYFEHHVKLLRPSDAPRQLLLEACEIYGAHLSRNAFRQPAPGKEERFVTLRSYGVGRACSDRRLRQLLAALAELGEHVIEHESEYCVFDSNLELDAGWLPSPG